VHPGRAAAAAGHPRSHPVQLGRRARPHGHVRAAVHVGRAAAAARRPGRLSVQLGRRRAGACGRKAGRAGEHARAAGRHERNAATAGCLCWCPGELGAELGPAGALLRQHSSVDVVLSSYAEVQLGHAACVCDILLSSPKWPVAHDLRRMGLYLLTAVTGPALKWLPPLYISRRLVVSLLCTVVSEHCCKSAFDLPTR